MKTLKDVLIQGENGLQLVGKHLIPDEPMPARELPIVREDFLSAVEAKDVKEHNLRYGNGLETEPRLLLSWLMLPTRCNQNCKGCYAGKDRKRMNHCLPNFYSPKKLDELLATLKRYGVRTLGYGGVGELFTMKRPSSPMGWREYIDMIIGHGFSMLIFTNGTLLTQEDIAWIEKRPISLIFSWRDTVASEHDKIVRLKNSFQNSVQALEFALRAEMQNDNRIGVEIPVIKSNIERVLYDFIPAMRYLGIIPYAEQYMQVCTSPEEKKMSLNFAEARGFFQRAQEIEAKFGYVHQTCFGQRMVSQTACDRPVFSVTIYPDGIVTPCPASSEKLGNVHESSLDEILLSEKYKNWLKDFGICACSVFYTDDRSQIPANIPNFLEGFK
ncbi:radical SAM protein [Candidatus Kuenenbacteria bacterium]|nr:radical SAM protein [Candidatus Kuenenbacteria bacterium]